MIREEWYPDDPKQVPLPGWSRDRYLPVSLVDQDGWKSWKLANSSNQEGVSLFDHVFLGNVEFNFLTLPSKAFQKEGPQTVRAGILAMRDNEYSAAHSKRQK